MPDETPVYNARDITRIVVAVVLPLVLLVLAAVTIDRANDVRPSGQQPSAIQVIQVYAEGCFYAIVAIGIGIAVYIGTRARD